MLIFLGVDCNIIVGQMVFGFGTIIHQILGLESFIKERLHRAFFGGMEAPQNTIH
jgi:hypothetical protein